MFATSLSKSYFLMSRVESLRLFSSLPFCLFRNAIIFETELLLTFFLPFNSTIFRFNPIFLIRVLLSLYLTLICFFLPCSSFSRSSSSSLSNSATSSAKSSRFPCFFIFLDFFKVCCRSLGAATDANEIS